MVELEHISGEEGAYRNSDQTGNLGAHTQYDIMYDMTKHDQSRLRFLIEHHMHFTDSSRARHILENWDTFLSKFIKVMPVDYRRALLEIQERSEDNQQSIVGVLAGE